MVTRLAQHHDRHIRSTTTAAAKFSLNHLKHNFANQKAKVFSKQENLPPRVPKTLNHVNQSYPQKSHPNYIVLMYVLLLAVIIK